MTGFFPGHFTLVASFGRVLPLLRLLPRALTFISSLRPPLRRSISLSFLLQIIHVNLWLISRQPTIFSRHKLDIFSYWPLVLQLSVIRYYLFIIASSVCQFRVCQWLSVCQSSFNLVIVSLSFFVWLLYSLRVGLLGQVVYLYILLIIHWLCSLTVHLLFIRRSITVHLSLTSRSFIVHLCSVYHSPAVHWLFVYYSFLVHLLFIYIFLVHDSDTGRIFSCALCH